MLNYINCSIDDLLAMAEKGDVEAQNILGVCYEYGLKTKRDDARAALFYTKAAENGHAEAQYNLGSMFERGTTMSPNPDQALYWWRKSAEGGVLTAQMILAKRSYADKDFTQAAFWLRKAAEQGNVEAQYMLGSMHAFGQGVAHDAEQAIELLKKASELNHIESNIRIKSNIRIGDIYYDKNETVHDYKKAFHWYKKALDIDNENGEILYKIGHMYYKGIGVKKNINFAFKFYERSANLNYDEAQYIIGKMYEYGIVVRKSLASARKFYKKSADNSNKSARIRYERLTNTTEKKRKLASENIFMLKFLYNAFNFFNASLFSDELPAVQITLSRGNFAGLFSGDFLSGDRCSIAINPKYVRLDDIDINQKYLRLDNIGAPAVLSTLVHEMVHLWVSVSGSDKGPFGSDKGQHGWEWGDKMEAIGLMPSSTHAPGGKRTGLCVGNYIIKGGAFSLACAKFMKNFGNDFLAGRNRGNSQALGAQLTSFVCPDCKQEAWAYPQTKFFCGTCLRLMTPAR